MKRLFCWITGFLLMVGLLQPFTDAHAQRSGWTTPFEVSPPVPGISDASLQLSPTPSADGKQIRYGSSWFPSIAIGPKGSVHIVWYSGIATTADSSGSIDMLMYRELHDGVWSPVNNVVVTGYGGYTVRNSIVMSRDGKLHVLLRVGTTIRHVSAPWDRAWNAVAWSEPHAVSSGGYYVALGVDSLARLHAFWSQGVLDPPGKPRPECPGCANLFYRYSDTGGEIWSEPVNLSNSPYGDNRPQVKVDSRDRIHVVWDQGKDWYVGLGKPKHGVYRRSDDRGETWRPPVYFTVPDDAVQQTTIGIAAGDNPIVVYRTLRGSIYYQYSRDGGDTWSLPALVPGIVARDTRGNDLDQYSMSTDGEGNVHLLVVGYPTMMSGIVPGDMPSMVLHLVWNGSRWSLPEIVSANELYPEWPVITVSNGNKLHAVWYTRRADGIAADEHDRYRVWYSSRQLNLPETAPLPLFTPVPTAAPTALPTATPVPPTPTPLPEDVATVPPISGPPRWETAALPVLALALLPSIAIVAIVYTVRRWRR
jgi:hypothetical protein